MSALPKPWEKDCPTRRRRVRALLTQAANHERKRCYSGSIAGAARLGGSAGGSLVKARGCQSQDGVPALADAACDAALKGSADCLGPTSANEVATTAHLGRYCSVNAFRVKQSLSPHHPAFPTDKHLVTEELHKLVCQASFRSRPSLLARVCNMAGRTKRNGRRRARSCQARGPSCQGGGR